MSAHSHATDHDLELDAERRWAIYRCDHGCFHVALDRLTLTLTEDELHALYALIHQARSRLHHRSAPSPVLTRAH